ncbi:MAG: 16S rRNA (cytosine(1402)-N(4))-methyltransferase RsmH [Clostridia bacterium]|nr:16S rRNA (cytosine(1402)-N(4))-methyltransferase RsmH [Clostridia bacterium]
MGEFVHRPVLYEETVDGLNVKPEGVYVDCTLGGAGHSSLLLSRLTTGRLIALDQDWDAIENAKKKLAPYAGKFELVHTNFEEVGRVLSQLAPEGIDGAMIDLGVSSYQLDTPERGFSYHYDAKLDMRMDRKSPLDAEIVVNTYSQSDLCRILKDYGEEKRAAQIARAIVKAREEKRIETTLELAEIIKSAFPPKERFEGKHPARRSFQAIRIEVNRELAVIPPTIRALVEHLKPGGRLSIITFHSLEDRTVKECIRGYTEGCTCPRDFPVCVCGFQASLKNITRKPIVPGAKEQEENPRSRSAKLRIAEKV